MENRVAGGKRLAIVTGANKGIGFEICRQLTSKGVEVILTARDEKRGHEAVSELRKSGLADVIFHPLDVRDSASVATLRNFIEHNYGKLDILVSNAGILGAGIDEEALRALIRREGKLEGEKVHLLMGVTRETYELALECVNTNYYGGKRVIEALMPLLHLCDSPRIVVISSTWGKLKFMTQERVKDQLGDVDHLTEERIDEVVEWYLKDYKEGLLETHRWPASPSAYKLTKAALNAYTRILARRHPTFRINCICPGYVMTDINWNTGILTLEEGARGPVSSWLCYLMMDPLVNSSARWRCQPLIEKLQL